METMINTNEYIEALEQLYKDYLKLTYDDQKELKRKSKDQEKMNEVIIKLVHEQENEYAKNYNEILKIVPNSLEEKLSQFQKLEAIEAQRKATIMSFLQMHEKNASQEVIHQLTSILKDEKLKELKDVINTIEKYIKNCAEMESLNNEIDNINYDLLQIDKNIAEDEKNIKSLEINLNKEINDVIAISPENLDDVDEIKTNYEDYKELYQGFKNKKHDKEIQKMLPKVRENYEKYMTLNTLLELKEIAASVGNYDNYLDKIENIKNHLKNIKEHPIAIAIKLIIDEQIKVLNKYQKQKADKLILQTTKAKKEKRYQELKELNESEKVIRVIGEFKDEKPMPNTKVGVITNPLTGKDVGRVIIDAKESDKAKDIIKQNEQKAIDWLGKVSKILNPNTEQADKVNKIR